MEANHYMGKCNLHSTELCSTFCYICACFHCIQCIDNHLKHILPFTINSILKDMQSNPTKLRESINNSKLIIKNAHDALAFNLKTVYENAMKKLNECNIPD